MPTLKIDEREIVVPAGTKVIDAAERLGIVIPRFCYHPALGAVGACRVCAVAFKEGPIKGIQMSCMVDAQDGMVVSTIDAEAVDFRRYVIEFLMLNHPHDCPVCDEGGHCLLQDLTVAGGHGLRRYRGRKRTHRNQDLGPLVQHEMNRCIQCYRCARYYQEFAGYRDLGVTGIGSRVYFGRISSGVLESPFAGNLIDICPTGVYTDKPSRYAGRRWDFERQPSVCLHCSLGCNLTVSARYRQVVRHEARANPRVNGHFICDRGRYGYPYASAADRPRQPMIAGRAVAMEACLDGAREALQASIDRSGPGSVALVAADRCSLETLAMGKRICRQQEWTGPVVAATRRQVLNARLAAERLVPELAVSLADLARAHDVIVIGADPINEAPMLAISLRQVQRRGGRVTVLDPRGIRLPFDFDHWAVHPMDLASLVREVIDRIGDTKALAAADSTPFPVNALAKRLTSSPLPMVVCGTDITAPEDVVTAAELADALRPTHKTVGLFYALTGANTFAASLAGADRTTASIDALLDRIENGAVRALVVVETDLWATFPDRARLQRALKRLDHLVVMDYVDSPLNREAHCFIPTRTIYEAGGHWVNQEGRLQAAMPVMRGGEPIAVAGGGDHPPRVFDRRIPGDSPVDAWAVLASLTENLSSADQAVEVLGIALHYFHQALKLPLSDSLDRRIVVAPLENAASRPETMESRTDITADDSITLLMVDRTFGTESLSASAPPLRALALPAMAAMHPETIAGLGMKRDERVSVTTDSGQLTLPLAADPGMARGVMAVPRDHRLAWQNTGEMRLTINRSRFKAER